MREIVPELPPAIPSHRSHPGPPPSVFGDFMAPPLTQVPAERHSQVRLSRCLSSFPDREWRMMCNYSIMVGIPGPQLILDFMKAFCARPSCQLRLHHSSMQQTHLFHAIVVCARVCGKLLISWVWLLISWVWPVCIAGRYTQVCLNSAAQSQCLVRPFVVAAAASARV